MLDAVRINNRIGKVFFAVVVVGGGGVLSFARSSNSGHKSRTVVFLSPGLSTLAIARIAGLFWGVTIEAIKGCLTVCAAYVKPLY